MSALALSFLLVGCDREVSTEKTSSVSSDGTWTLIAPEFGGLANSGTWSAGYGGNTVRGATRPSFQK